MTENPVSSTENEWQIVEFAPPTEPQETEPEEERSNTVRERRPTRLFNITGLRSKSYD